MTVTAHVATYAQLPLRIVGGRDCRLFAADGREYWDFYGGHAVCIAGHSRPEIRDALAAQADALAFYSNVLPLEVRDRAALRLTRFAGAGMQSVFFCNSGAEANENALKLAIQRTGRTRIAALTGGWHGRTLLALSATTDAKLLAPLAPLLCDCVKVTPNAIDELERIDETVAAVLVEPILSIAGIVELSAEFLKRLRERCTAVGAMLIYDEIQTGMGRLGRPFVAGAHGVHPDMLTSAKGLANGVPAGALFMSAEVAAGVKSGDLGSTFGGGPLACAAILATLEIIERERLCERAARIGESCRERLCVGPVTHVLGRGCLVGLKVPTGARPVQEALLTRGFITGTSADPAVLRLMPPLTLPEAAIDALAAALAALPGENTANVSPPIAAVATRERH